MPANSRMAELDMWHLLWTERKKNLKTNESLPDSVSATLTHTDPDTFPVIQTGLRILATIPVTSCTCERSISALRRLKTYTRSTMGAERLNGLALLHTQYKMEIDINTIIGIFSRRYPRRLQLTDILKD